MLIGIAIFLLLVVVVLAIPVTLTYQLAWNEALSASLRLNWAFGLLRADVSPDLAKSETPKAQASRKKSARRRKTNGSKINFVAAIRQQTFRRRILRFVSDIWNAIHKKNVQLQVRMGLGDPADTGRLWAVLGPLSGTFVQWREVRIAIEPDFLDSTLEVESSGTLRIIPLQVTSIALGLLVSPPVWRGILLMRKAG